ncbi:MAG: hypothetical protein KGO49_11980 [Gammaproteobacteria bacterium]|nr:hypothetical protein [Gammaproteobacteria bacterium]
MFSRVLLTQLLAVSLVACGGGGGNSSTQSPTPTSTQSPTPSSAAKSANIASISMALTDTTIQIADTAVQFIRSQNQGFVSTTTCANGGHIDWTWNDADNSHTLSVGDTLVGTLQDCSLRTNTFRGVLSVAITQPTTVGSGNSAFNVTTDLAEYDAGSHEWRPITGSFGAQVFSNTNNYNVTLSLGNNGLSFSNSAGVNGSVERIHDAVISRNLNLSAARYTVNLTGQVESATIADTITISTPTALQGYLDTYPDTGTFNFSTGQHAASLTSNNVVNNQSANYRYDVQNNGVINSPIQLVDWSTLINGYLFFYTRPLNLITSLNSLPFITNGSSNSLQVIDIFGTGSFNSSTSQFTTNTPSPDFIYQFSRPLDSTRVPNFTLSNTAAFATSNATTNVNDAQLFVSSSAPLATGSYSVSAAGAIYDQSGVYSTYINSISFTVPNTLVASATASSTLASTGASIVLDASASTSILGNITSYSWTQISGSTVSLQNSNTAKPTFIVPALSSGSSLLQFKVTVTNSTGFVQSAIVNVYAYQTVNTFELLDYTSDTGDYIGQGKAEAFLADSGLTFTGTNSKIAVALPVAGSEWWNLNFSSSTPFAVGTYSATRWPFSGSLPGLDFSGSGRGCNNSTDSFTIYDIAYDGSGNITRLAVDFTQHCEGATPALHGRFRYHSIANL